MRLPPDFMPDFKPLIVLMRDMAEERSVERLLRMLVDRLSERPPIALVQVWLKHPGDICPSCLTRSKCRQSGECLHLVTWASRYKSSFHSEKIDKKAFPDRIPLDIGLIGRVGSTGKSIELTEIKDKKQMLPLPAWVPSGDIVGFLCHPLINHDQILGVFAIFLRMEPLPEGILWSRVIADHTATAIANARAFEEIETLKRKLELENEYLREEVTEARAFGDLIGKSSAMLKVIQQIGLVAPTDATVLILGESGTGKELVAREIHKRSQRCNRPMIKINCASVAKELYESEFFGHVKGAFTGAVRDRAGRFEAADSGTLFLDEVGEIPLELQSKLLRVLQDGSYEKVGGESTRNVDVRIITATNKNLRQEVDENRFRTDLYYRLNVFPIEIEPLRNRKEDIPLLANHFLKQLCKKMTRKLPRLTKSHLTELQNYDWPGNVRELQNVIERTVITLQSGLLRFDLHLEKSGYFSRKKSESRYKVGNTAQVMTEADIQNLVSENLRAVLDRTNGKIYGPMGAAEILGIKPTTLSARIKKFGLK